MYVALETSPPPFMAKTILNIHFDYLIPQILTNEYQKFSREFPKMIGVHDNMILSDHVFY